MCSVRTTSTEAEAMLAKLLRYTWGLSPGATELLLDLLRRYRGYAAVSLAAGFASALMEGGTLAFLTLALNSLGSGEPSRAARIAESVGESVGLGGGSAFVVLVAGAVIAQVLHSVLHFVSDAANGNLQAHVEKTARIRIFDQFMRFSYGEARRHQLGALTSHMDQVNFLGMGVNRMHEVVSQMMLLAVYVTLVLWISWPATLVALAAMLALSLMMRGIMRGVRKSGLR